MVWILIRRQYLIQRLICFNRLNRIYIGGRVSVLDVGPKFLSKCEHSNIVLLWYTLQISIGGMNIQCEAISHRFRWSKWGIYVQKGLWCGYRFRGHVTLQMENLFFNPVNFTTIDLIVAWLFHRGQYHITSGGPNWISMYRKVSGSEFMPHCR